MLLLIAGRSAGLDGLALAMSMIVFVVGFINSGRLVDGGVPHYVIFAGLIAVSALTYFRSSSPILQAVLLWGTIAIFFYPILLVVTTSLGESSDVPRSSQLLADVDLTIAPRDVVFVIADGYASGETMSEVYGYDNSDVFRQLEDSGFDVFPNLVANYGRTRLSVASLLRLDYVADTSQPSEADLAGMLDELGGENTLAAWLQSSGYLLTYVESGWLGSRCGSSVDLCYQRPWPGEEYYDIAYRSFLRGLPGFEEGHPFHQGALNAIEWLRRDLESALSNDVPEFIHLHLLAPHPPLFLDPSCNSDVNSRYQGFTIPRPDMSPLDLDNARDRYVAQVECVNRVIVNLARLAHDNDAIVVFTGDHGPDSLGQLYTDGASWSDAQRSERLTTAAAIRVPDCSIHGVESLVNVSRRLVSCMSDATLPDLPTRVFETEFVEDGQRLVEVAMPSLP